MVASFFFWWRSTTKIASIWNYVKWIAWRAGAAIIATVHISKTWIRFYWLWLSLLYTREHIIVCSHMYEFVFFFFSVFRFGDVNIVMDVFRYGLVVLLWWNDTRREQTVLVLVMVNRIRKREQMIHALTQAYTIIQFQKSLGFTRSLLYQTVYTGRIIVNDRCGWLTGSFCQYTFICSGVNNSNLCLQPTTKTLNIILLISL